jgi:hypothetical protein
VNLSARAYDRILKSRAPSPISRQIDISPEHVSEAIQYRTFVARYGSERRKNLAGIFPPRISAGHCRSPARWSFPFRSG